MTEYVSGELVANLHQQVSYLEAPHTPIKTQPAEPADPLRSEPDREDPQREEPAKVEPQPSVEEPQEAAEPRSWWSRLFGG